MLLLFTSIAFPAVQILQHNTSHIFEKFIKLGGFTLVMFFEGMKFFAMRFSAPSIMHTTSRTLTDCQSIAASSLTSFFGVFTSLTFWICFWADRYKSQGPIFTNCRGLAAGFGTDVFMVLVGIISIVSCPFCETFQNFYSIKRCVPRNNNNHSRYGEPGDLQN